jgi:hypothetical protein
MFGGFTAAYSKRLWNFRNKEVTLLLNKPVQYSNPYEDQGR